VPVDLYVYADESGIQAGAPFCVVAGYIGNPETWETLRRSWKKVINGFGVTEFKSTEFFTRNTLGQRVGEYEGWSNKKARRYLAALTDLIHGANIEPIGVGIIWAAFKALSIGERRYLTGGNLRVTGYSARWKGSTGAPTKPYFFLMLTLMKLSVGKTISEKGFIHFTFDEQNEFDDHAERLYREIKATQLHPVEMGRMGDLKFSVSKRTPELQAADMYAHIVYSRFTRGNDMESGREIAADVLTRKQPGFPILDADALREWMALGLPPEVLEKIRASK
jgi:hypothetical protein